MRNRIPIFILFLLLISSNVSCQQPKLEKVKIASGGHIVHFLPLDIAVAKGFFTDEGLDPEITQLNGGTAAAQALLAEQVDFSLNSIDHAFKAAVQGKDNLRMIVLLNQTPGMVLVVDSRLREKVKNISDLKGMTLGVTSKGSATHMVLASLLSKSGVNPDNVNIINAGSATFPPALENGQIAGGIALEPFASFLVEQGKAFILADLNTLKDTERFFGGPYNQAGVMTRQDMIERRPDLVQKIVTIHVRALKWIQAHTPQEIADALPIEVVGTDKVRYVKTLEKLREFYSHDGIVKPQGVENVYNSMIASGSLPSNTTLKLEQFYTNTFVNKAHTSASSNSQVKSQTSFAQSNSWWNKLVQLYTNTFVNEVQASISSNQQEKLKASPTPTINSPEETDQKLKGSFVEKIDWVNALVGAIIGAFVTFILSAPRLKREKKEKQEAVQARQLAVEKLNKIKEQLDTKERDFQEKHGFVPIDIGLEAFEDRICERVKKAKKSVKLCLSTPLLYSLKANPWRTYSRKFLNENLSDYWPKNFCEQFRKILRERVAESTTLDVELIYLDERSTKTLVSEMNPRVPYVEHRESLDFFIDEVLKKDERANHKLCNLKVHRVMKVPFYLALVDTDEASGVFGIVAFANDNYLLNESIKEKRMSEDMAKTLQGYEFTKHDVVRFMNQLFEQTKLLSDERLVNFLDICTTSGFSWSAIADGVPDAKKELKPHATLLHIIKEAP